METLGEYHYRKIRCLNCGLNLAKAAAMTVANLALNHQEILGQWIDQRMVEGGKICLACLNKIENCENEDNPQRKLGHELICAGCGKALYKKKYRIRHDEGDLALLFSSYKQYKWCEVPYFFCKACDQRKNHRIKKLLKAELLKTEHNNALSDSLNKTEDTKAQPIQIDAASDLTANKALGSTNLERQEIYKKKIAAFKNDHLILPGYKRVPISVGKCVMPKCRAPGRPIPRSKRKLIFLKFNSLLTRRATLCQRHTHTNEWGFGYNNFSIHHVESVLHMCEKRVPIIEFNSINEMPDHICKYWTGLTVDQFKELYDKLNVDTTQFQSLKNALAIHLLRKKTGDNILKLANLFMMSTQMLSKQLLVIEKCLETYSDLNDNDDK